MFRRLAKNEFKKDRLLVYVFIFVAIVFIISIFDYRADPYLWFIEMLRNLVLSLCIALFVFLSSITLGFFSFQNRWVKYLVRLIFWTLGGIFGAGLGWLINDLLFGFNVTHPYLFFLMTGSISIAVSFFATAYLFLKDQVEIMAEKLSKKEMNEQKLIQLKTKAELVSLRSKVNPHFFFNTLNTIAGLIPSEPEKAEELIEKFSTLFRYPFTEMKNEYAELDTEIEFIKNYLEIEQSRLGKRLEYHIEVDKTLSDFPIPVMILQPLVENSIIHGISPLKEGGVITVKCVPENSMCKIVISDTGVGFNTNSNKNGFGIGGVKERLSLYYPGNHQFEIASSTGVEITMVIPK